MQIGPLLPIAMMFTLASCPTSPAMAWGDEGHEVIALIADAHLDPVVQKKIKALLAADPDPLTAHDIASAATWPDKLRDVNQNGARQGTRQWHFVDIEIVNPDLDRACFGHPSLPAGTPASNGPAQDCVVDKIQQFAAELANPAADPEEQIVALKFLLHFVGDLHQPLHAADSHDRGGNDKSVSAAGLQAGTLHHYWDTTFVDQLGPNANRIATDLNEHMSQHDLQAWAQGEPSDWAMDSFRLAKDDAYGRLPSPNARGSFRLPDDYLTMARRDVAIQLSKAGVRLAFLLNKALGSP